MLNTSGESGHPCLIPDLRGNDFRFSPLRILLASHRWSLLCWERFPLAHFLESFYHEWILSSFCVYVHQWYWSVIFFFVWYPCLVLVAGWWWSHRMSLGEWHWDIFVFIIFIKFLPQSRLKIFGKEWLIKIGTVWLVLPNYFLEKYIKKLSKITIRSSPQVHNT